MFGGARVSKSNERINAYGTIDELNAHIGLVRDQETNQHRAGILIEIQDRLFTIGSILATAPNNEKVKIPKLRVSDIDRLEKEIDAMEAELPPMKNFILPGGHTSVSICHIARCVCRRAERLVVALDERETVNPEVVQYLNRLSDYLFVLGRKMAMELGAKEMPWQPQM